MAREIERRFVVENSTWREQADSGLAMRQGFLFVTKEKVVRVRIAGDRGWLTVKAAISDFERQEFEYDIPREDAESMLNHLCPVVISKTRYRVPAVSLVWEIDVYEGDNQGLVLAEIELPHIDAAFERPDWLGHEVTQHGRLTNAQLSQQPFNTWTQAERDEILGGVSLSM